MLRVAWIYKLVRVRCEYVQRMLRAAGFQNEHAYAAYRGSERKLCLLGCAAAELGVTSSARPRQLFRAVRLRDAKIAAKRSVWGVFDLGGRAWPSVSTY